MPQKQPAPKSTLSRAGLKPSSWRQERGRVDAVAQPGRLGAVVERVAEMRVTPHTVDLSADHAVAHVALGADIFGGHRLEKPRPAGAGVELRVRAKQRRPAADAGIDVAFAVVVKEPAERALGTVGARNAILIGHRASVCIVGFMMRRRCFCHEKRSIARYIK